MELLIRTDATRMTRTYATGGDDTEGPYPYG